MDTEINPATLTSGLTIARPVRLVKTEPHTNEQRVHATPEHVPRVIPEAVLASRVRTPADVIIQRPTGNSRATALRGEINVNEQKNEAREGLARKLLMEMGDEVVQALQDPETTDVERNTDGSLWITHGRKGPRQITGSNAIDDYGALNLIGTVAALAEDGRQDAITTKSPHLETSVPEIYLGMPGAGCRFTATIQPQAKRPMFSFRKPSLFIPSLTDYLDDGLLTPKQYAYLINAVAKRHNIAVVGETGSGKTTLMKSILKEMSETAGITERFAIIEDTAELVCTAPRHYHQYTVPYYGIHLKQCVMAALRYTPTRITVGEIRGPGAYDLIDAWCTGHKGGLVSIHAGDAIGTLERFRRMSIDEGQHLDHSTVAGAIDDVITVNKENGWRHINIFSVVKKVSSRFEVDEIAKY